MAYTPQYGPGKSSVAENRRKQMNPSVKLEKLRSVTDEDVVLILGHRAPGNRLVLPRNGKYNTCLCLHTFLLSR